MIRCSECKKNIIDRTKYQEWLELMNFFHFLHLQEDISLATRDRMVDILMTFKAWACEEDTNMAHALEKIAYDNVQEGESDIAAIARFREVARKGLGDKDEDDDNLISLDNDEEYDKSE